MSHFMLGAVEQAVMTTVASIPTPARMTTAAEIAQSVQIAPRARPDIRAVLFNLEHSVQRLLAEFRANERDLIVGRPLSQEVRNRLMADWTQAYNAIRALN
jgi:hypothetical protein